VVLGTAIHGGNSPEKGDSFADHDLIYVGGGVERQGKINDS